MGDNFIGMYHVRKNQVDSYAKNIDVEKVPLFEKQVSNFDSSYNLISLIAPNLWNHEKLTQIKETYLSDRENFLKELVSKFSSK